AKLYERFNNRHLEPLLCEAVGADAAQLVVRTSQSNLHVAIAARTQAFVNGAPVGASRTPVRDAAYVGQDFEVAVREGDKLSLEKVAALYSSRDQAISESGLAARKAILRAGRYDDLRARHMHVWKHLWRRFDVQLREAGTALRLNTPMLLRLHILHLLQAASPNSVGLDVGVPARGWTGEAYQGHIFWDELFIF